MAQSRLHEVYALGQSPWYDNIRRGLIESGDLQGLIDNDSIVGVTSNPAIFEKAISGSTDYDEQLRELVKQGTTDPRQIFEELSVRDIQAAADVLRPVWERSNHLDGYISLEVSPGAANDTTATIAEARHLHQRVNRPNLMVKIPATAAGIPAIEQMIYEGVNINVTLIFALEVYRQVAEAFIRGLEHRQREGQPVHEIASVASFFVSRVDSMVDKLLDEQLAATDDSARQEQISALKGKAAIANAKLAYKAYTDIFHGERFATLHAAGAQPQRCLWASTSTKNPAYRDVMYVEQLIGPETVDTMPPQTIVAFQEHGEVRRTVDENLAAAEETMRQLAEVGIDMSRVTSDLEIEGVRLFAEPFDKLMASTAEKTERLRQEMNGADTSASASAAPSLADQQRASLGVLQGAVDATLDRADSEHFAARVWEKDPALWKPNPAEQHEITDRLGWLTVAEAMRDALPRLHELRDDLRQAGFTDCVLLGMGGSSLAPEVLRQTYGVAQGQPKLHVLDSTDPATILHTEQRVDLAHTLFIVASKSGGTIETLTQFQYFHEKVQAIAGERTGEHFIAITDPGTKLEQMAHDYSFRAVFRNPADIGGRYSALSFFGLVPAAIIGVDVEKLLDRAETMQHACHGSGPARQNPGTWLGAIMGSLARQGRDKVTILVSPPIASFGVWLEQLLAESTGKEGKGLVPVAGESLGAPAVYGEDRLFVYLRTDDGGDAAQDAAVETLAQAGQPVVWLTLKDAYDLGQEFFRWEFATAIAGAVLGINAFDQPNVQEAKDKTNAILAQYQQSQKLPEPQPVLQTETRNVSLVAEGAQATRLRESVSLQAALETFASEASPGDYIALLAYIEDSPATNETLQKIRLRLRDTRHVATTLGYGPRFQHSTGQLHKGGANNGVFIQIVAQDVQDVPIPGEPYTFGVLKQAQALGDLQSLEAHERRVIRIALDKDIAAGLAEVQRALDAAHLG